MKTISVISFLLALSFPATADTYLCIAEEAGQIVRSETEVLESNSGSSDFRVVVREDGLYQFGDDYPWLTECDFRENGKPSMCELEGDGFSGYFSMTDDNVFTLVRMAALNDDITEVSVTVFGGKCSRI